MAERRALPEVRKQPMKFISPWLRVPSAPGCGIPVRRPSDFGTPRKWPHFRFREARTAPKPAYFGDYLADLAPGRPRTAHFQISDPEAPKSEGRRTGTVPARPVSRSRIDLCLDVHLYRVGNLPRQLPRRQPEGGGGVILGRDLPRRRQRAHLRDLRLDVEFDDGRPVRLGRVLLAAYC